MRVLVHEEAHLNAILEVALLLLIRRGIDTKKDRQYSCWEYRGLQGTSHTWSVLYIAWNIQKIISSRSLEDMIE